MGDVNAVHAVDLGIVIEKMIVMRALGREVAGAGFVVFSHQAFVIKVLCMPQGANVLVTEFGIP